MTSVARRQLGQTAGSSTIAWPPPFPHHEHRAIANGEGEVELEGTLEVDADTSWAYGGITPPSGGFVPGDYEVRLELNGDEETLEFTVRP